LPLAGLRQLVDVQALPLSLLEFLAVAKSNRAGSTHASDLSGRPCQVHISAKALGAHLAVCSAISLAQGHSDLWNGCFAVGVEQLRAAAQNAVVLLVNTWQEAWYVDAPNQWAVESGACPD